MQHEPMRLDCPKTIRKLRRERGMTLAQAAVGAGTTAAQVMKLENGDRRLTLDWLERLAKALDCSVLDIVAPARLAVIDGFLTSQWSVQPTVRDPRLNGVNSPLSVTVPRGCDPDTVVVIRRQTLDRSDFFGGATFYFERVDDPTQLEVYEGRICLLTMADGQQHVRRIAVTNNGISRQIYFFAPGDAPDIVGKVTACYPCLAIADGPEAVEHLCGKPAPAAEPVRRAEAPKQPHAV